MKQYRDAYVQKLDQKKISAETQKKLEVSVYGMLWDLKCHQKRQKEKKTEECPKDSRDQFKLEIFLIHYESLKMTRTQF